MNALLQQRKTKYDDGLMQAFERAKDYVPTMQDFLDSYWKNFKRKVRNANIYDTGVKIENLKEIGW